MQIETSSEGSLGEWFEAVLVLLAGWILGGAMVAGMKSFECPLEPRSVHGPKIEGSWVSFFNRFRKKDGSRSSWTPFPFTFQEAPNLSITYLGNGEGEVNLLSNTIYGQDFTIQNDLVTFFLEARDIIPMEIRDETSSSVFISKETWKHLKDRLELGYNGYMIKKLTAKYPLWMNRAFPPLSHMESPHGHNIVLSMFSRNLQHLEDLPRIWVLTKFGIYDSKDPNIHGNMYGNNFIDLWTAYLDKNPEHKNKKSFDAALLLLCLMAGNRVNAQASTIHARVISVQGGQEDKGGYTVIYMYPPQKWVYSNDIAEIKHVASPYGVFFQSKSSFKPDNFKAVMSLVSKEINDPLSNIRIVDLECEKRGDGYALKSRHWSLERIENLFS